MRSRGIIVVSLLSLAAYACAAEGPRAAESRNGVTKAPASSSGAVTNDAATPKADEPRVEPTATPGPQPPRWTRSLPTSTVTREQADKFGRWLLHARFHFPEIARQRYADLFAEVEARTGW